MAKHMWTEEQKAEVLAYAKANGRKATLEHDFNGRKVHSSMLARWDGKFGGYTKKRRQTRKWTPAKVKQVLAFKAEHTTAETLEKFKVSSAQLHYWTMDQKRGVEFGTSQREAGQARDKAKGTRTHHKHAKGNGALHGKSNGIGLDKEVLMHLRNWRTGQLAWIRENPKKEPPDYDVFAELALRALRE